MVKHGNRVLTCTESYLPFEIEIGKGGVKSVGFTDLDGMLVQTTGPKYGTFSAHPIIDPDTKEMFFFSKNGGPDSLPQVAFGYGSVFTCFYINYAVSLLVLLKTETIFNLIS